MIRAEQACEIQRLAPGIERLLWRAQSGSGRAKRLPIRRRSGSLISPGLCFRGIARWQPRDGLILTGCLAVRIRGRALARHRLLDVRIGSGALASPRLLSNAASCRSRTLRSAACAGSCRACTCSCARSSSSATAARRSLISAICFQIVCGDAHARGPGAPARLLRHAQRGFGPEDKEPFAIGNEDLPALSRRAKCTADDSTWRDNGCCKAPNPSGPGKGVAETVNLLGRFTSRPGCMRHQEAIVLIRTVHIVAEFRLHIWSFDAERC
jgi:hypothetical protein